MKNIWLFLILAGLMVTSCTGKKGQAGKTDGMHFMGFPPLSSTNISAPELYDFITVKADYKKYGNMPGEEGMREGSSPHGALVHTYVNPTGLAAMRKGAWVMPHGTIIVKENFNRDQELLALTVMMKVSNSFSQGGDWYWAKFEEKGGEAVCGPIQSCLVCHSGAKGNDYLFTYIRPGQ